MVVYRLSKKKYARLSGDGAAFAGGRWNAKGTAIIYTSDSCSLAMLEKYIHLPSGILPKDLVMICIDIPDNLIKKKIELKTLPADWKNDTGLLTTRNIGDDFIVSKSACVLQVPSAIVPGDHNYLINPDHSDFSKIKIIEIVDFPFDDRLFEK
ncbi:MAG: RES domain-containing protein [Candidatus Marinimicrobia bacterium]|nr:RES domain-containing protein [Candidatus Neomarinimicrobiota bacterium]